MAKGLKLILMAIVCLYSSVVTPNSNAASQDPIENCKVPNANSNSVHLGSNRNPLFMKSSGTVKILVAGVDFVNARESAPPAEMITPFQLTEVSNFYRVASFGKLNLEFTLVDQVVNLPLNDTSPNEVPIARSAAQNIPSNYNLSEFDGLILITPKNSNYSASSANVATTLAGKNGQISSSAVLAGVKPGEARWLASPWRTLAHEIGHMMGLMDLWNRQDSQAWSGVTAAPFGIMNTGAGWNYAADFFVWEKWILGWISSEQIWCQNLSEKDSAINLSKPAENVGIKLVVIRLSPTEVLAIEARENGVLDYGVTKSGLLVYKIDFTKNQFEVPITLVPSAEAMSAKISEQIKDWQRFKSATLGAFETVDSGSWRIGSASTTTYSVLLSKNPGSVFMADVLALKDKAQAEAQAKAQAEAQAKAQAEAQAKALASKKITIKCVKGKKVRIVSGLKPKCPIGFSPR